MIDVIRAITLTNIFLQVTGALTGIIVARLLGPEIRGEFAVALLWPSILAHLAIMGGDVSMGRIGAGHRITPRTMYRAALLLAALLGLASILTGFYLLPYVLPENKLYLLSFARFLLLVVPAMMLHILLTSIELGQANYSNFNFIRAAYAFLWLTGLCIIGISLPPTLDAVVWALIVSSCIGSVFSFLYVYINSRGSISVTPLSISDVVKSGLPFGAVAIITIAYVNVATAWMTFLFPPRAIGIYVVGFTAASLNISVTHALSKACFSYVAGHQNEDLCAWFSRTFRYSLVLHLAIAFLMVLIGPPLIPLIFGYEFKDSALLMVALVPATTILGLAQIVDESLKAKGVARGCMWARVMGCVCLSCVVVVVGQRLDLYGMAIAVGVGAIAELYILLRFASSTFHTPMNALLVPKKSDWHAIALKYKDVLRLSNPREYTK